LNSKDNPSIYSEKQTKKKKKGIYSFFKRICHIGNKVAPLSPQPATDREDPQPGPSRVTSTPDIRWFHCLIITLVHVNSVFIFSFIIAWQMSL